MQPELTERILQHIERVDSVNTLHLVNILNENHQKIIGALKSIEATGDLVRSEPASSKTWELTGEGHEVVLKGSHEAIVFYAIPADGIAQQDLMKVRSVLTLINRNDAII